MYYVPPALPAPPPPPPSGPMLNTSPPQQVTSNSSNPATPRYMAAYPPYHQTPSTAQLCHPNGPSLPPTVQQQTHQDRPQQSVSHNGMYVAFIKRIEHIFSPWPDTGVSHLPNSQQIFPFPFSVLTKSEFCACELSYGCPPSS
jgi:hypothetical protein